MLRSVLFWAGCTEVMVQQQRTLRVIMPNTMGFGGQTNKWCRPMVLNSRYDRAMEALACVMKGVRCMNGRRSTHISSSGALKFLQQVTVSGLRCTFTLLLGVGSTSELISVA